MSTTDRDIDTAQWMLERQLHWIAQAEVKVAALLTLDIAMIGGLFAAWSTIKTHPLWPALLSAISTGFMCGAVFCAAFCLMPRVSAPTRSGGLYFGQIAATNDPADFVAAHRKKSSQDILEDWLFQVHRNAQIAKAKHEWVRRGLLCSFAGAAAWLAAVIMLVEV